ncbi:Tc toxin subunit A [Pseudomonas sp. FP1740]|uniref:Tc toxin subunit A n=1 Tax=Pseudomonas sp. FP1740 TaxID=2954078 RepID=UPI00273466DF|nr:Tc toxin subunit A [Pseudomonas sp. FP1740]WLG43838.1 Tc toxin subunit A [Pseudomonas sp. FP1740]
MTHEIPRPTLQLVNGLFTQERSAELGKLQAFIRQGGNVFDLVERSAGQLCAEFELTVQEASQLLKCSYSLAFKLIREYREHQMTRSTGNVVDTRTGLQALVDTPRFDELFEVDTAKSTPANAIGSTVSPVAYLMSIISWAQQLERTGDNDTTIRLFDRRPDLLELLIDEAAVNSEVPMLTVVNTVLSFHLDKNKQRDDDVDSLLRSTRYPHELPYDRAWRSIDYAARSRDPTLSLGAIVRATDGDFPYFIRSSASGKLSDTALRLALGLAPGQQALLLESVYPLSKTQQSQDISWVNPRSREVVPLTKLLPEAFYQANFDCDNYRYLLPLKNFLQKTRLKREGVERLLSIGAFAPRLSPNAPAERKGLNPDLPIDDNNPVQPTTPKDFGSVFINEGMEPPIGLERATEGENKGQFTLTNIDEKNQRRFDRINRMVRLNQWLELNPHETDQLVIAAIMPEVRQRQSASIEISENTLRALGLFQELRTHYGISAEDGAAILNVISAYEHGNTLSHFDRVFNAQSLFQTPLQVDDVEFSVFPVNAEDQRTADHLCSALGIDFDTYLYIAVQIAAAHSPTLEKPDPTLERPDLTLKRSLSVFSSFYRLVRFPRLLGISPLEGMALLTLLDSRNNGWLARLAGPTHIAMYQSDEQSDVLSILHAGMSLVQWCQRNELSPKWLIHHVSDPIVPVVAGDPELELLMQLSAQLQPVRMTEVMLLDASVPPDSSGLGWMKQLETVVDGEGLIIGISDRSDADYMQWVRAEITVIVDGLIELVTDRPWIIEAILTVVLRARAGQRALVQESFAVYLQLPSDLALPVIVWSGGYVYQLLSQALKAIARPEAMAIRLLGWSKADPSEQDSEQREFLRLLVELQRRSEVARELKLSSAMLISYLENSSWFGIEDVRELSLTTVFYLTLYGRAVKLAKQPAQKLLDYLKQVNQELGEISEDEEALVRDAAAALLAGFFGCGIKEVLACAIHANPPGEDDTRAPLPLIRNLKQLALLLRMLETRDQTGLDFDALLMLGKLTPVDSDATYRAAAQRALESLSETSIASSGEEASELGQSLNVVCEVDREKLVANVPNHATFTLTLRDYTGKLLKYVQVRWSHTGEGVLMDPLTRTDQNGKVKARLLAGSKMGIAHVSYRLSLREEVAAASVLIDCDDKLRALTSSMSVEPKRNLLAGEKEFATLKVRFIDDYGNVARGKQINWTTTLGTLRPNPNFTDQTGLATVLLNSDLEGPAIVTARYVEGGEGAQFDPVNFVDEPQIKALMATTQAVVGQTLTIMCELIGLNGKPLPGQEVTFSAGDERTKKSITDADGKAYWDVPELAEGLLQVTAVVGTAGQNQTLELWVAAQVLISDFAEKWLVPVADSTEASEIWIKLSDKLDSGQPIALYPVDWSLERLLPAPKHKTAITIPTDQTGRSTFMFMPGVVGKYKLTAEVQWGVDFNGVKEFELNVLPAFEWKVDLISNPDQPDKITTPVVPGTGELELSADVNYRLEISPISEPLKGGEAILGWTQAEGSSAATVGLAFTPRLAQPTVFPDGDVPLTWEIACDARNDRTFGLVLSCPLVNRPLVLKGKVLKKLPASHVPMTSQAR